jgi:hypothetical protein
MARRKREGAMHVATTRRHYKDRVYETHLLRRSYRDAQGRPRNETLANLSHLPDEVIEMIRRALRGEDLVTAGETFEIRRSLPHGHVAAVAAAANKLGLPALLGPAGRQRDIAFALVVARVCRPASKLATTRWWTQTTLAADLDLESVGTDEVYEAMDWLVARQATIEKKLASRHLSEGGLVFFDVSSSWLEGRACPLGAIGYSRDGKRGKLQITYGLTCDPDGRPVAVEVFKGNTGDPTAFTAAVSKVRDRFGLRQVVMVGDRGMITSARIDALRELGGIGWITALRAPAIKKLAESGHLQLSLFDQTDLAEITQIVGSPSPAFKQICHPFFRFCIISAVEHIGRSFHQSGICHISCRHRIERFYDPGIGNPFLNQNTSGVRKIGIQYRWLAFGSKNQRIRRVYDNLVFEIFRTCQFNGIFGCSVLPPGCKEKEKPVRNYLKILK